MKKSKVNKISYPRYFKKKDFEVLGIKLCLYWINEPGGKCFTYSVEGDICSSTFDPLEARFKDSQFEEITAEELALML